MDRYRLCPLLLLFGGILYIILAWTLSGKEGSFQSVPHLLSFHSAAALGTPKPCTGPHPLTFTEARAQPFPPFSYMCTSQDTHPTPHTCALHATNVLRVNVVLPRPEYFVARKFVAGAGGFPSTGIISFRDDNSP